MRIVRRLAAALAVVASVLAASAGPGYAAISATSAWWTAFPSVLAPDIEREHLLVQGGPDPSRPLAYAGISFVLAPEERPRSLELSVAPGSATVPGAALALCPLDGRVTAEAHGAPADDGPSFDCEASRVEAEPSADGTTYTFDVTGLAGGASLDVAVVPTTGRDRVELVRPTTADLRSDPGAAGTSGDGEGAFGGPGDIGTDASDRSTSTPPGTADPSTSFDAPGSTGTVPSFDSPEISPGDDETAGEAAGEDPEDELADRAPTVPLQRAGGEPPVDDGSSRSVAPFVFVALAGAAAVLWGMAGQESPSLEPEARQGAHQ